jgi:hypothetical protein
VNSSQAAEETECVGEPSASTKRIVDSSYPRQFIEWNPSSGVQPMAIPGGLGEAQSHSIRR